ncbi:hypothetical protein BZL39_K05380 [Zygosaccharomyces parabailii]|nr:hypothetical protein BZL39_K05380 [Zygosaccharomyces parabailii]
MERIHSSDFKSPKGFTEFTVESSLEKLEGNIEESFEPHQKYEEPTWKTKHVMKLNLLIYPIILSGIFNGFDAFLMASVQMSPHWFAEMGNPSGAVLGALTAGPQFGYCMALWVARYVSDRFGRKPASLVGAIITTVGALIQSFSNCYAAFMVSRIILGWGLSFYFVSAPAWISELALPNHRSIFVSIMNGSAFLGRMMATWIAYGAYKIDSNWQWRIPALSQLSVTIFHLIIFWFVPESPRFLLSKNKAEKARSVLIQYHAGGNMKQYGDFVNQEYSQIVVALKKEQETANFSWMAFFQSKKNFHRFAICAFMGFMQYNVGLFAITYYMNPVLKVTGYTSDREQLLILAILVTFNFVIAYGPPFIITKFQRRRVFLCSLIALFASYLVFVVLSGINAEGGFKKGYSKGILALIFIFYFLYDVSFLGMLTVYIMDILSFALRSRGIMVYIISGQIWVIFNSFITPVAMDSISWRFYIVYCCTIVFCFAFVFFLFPETKGLNLEQTDTLFEKGASMETYNR